MEADFQGFFETRKYDYLRLTTRLQVRDGGWYDFWTKELKKEESQWCDNTSFNEHRSALTCCNKSECCKLQGLKRQLLPCFSLQDGDALFPAVNLIAFPIIYQNSCLTMLCEICSNIDVDALIPIPAILESGIFSGTRHHSSLERLGAASKAGCDLCKTIETLAVEQVQNARLNRLRQLPVWLKMRMQGADSPDYQGASRLLVSVGAMIIAELEAYIPRGVVRQHKSLSLMTNV